MKAPSPRLNFARWIVWEDDWLVAVDKPAGVLSQGGEGGAGINVVDLARAYTGRPQVGVLHRIDRNVSGLVLIAKHAGAARAMTRLFARGAVVRTYRAVVFGRPAQERFVMESWLTKDRASNRVRAADHEALEAMDETAREAYRPARTEAEIVERFEPPLGACAALDVRPISGRSHQIRVHLASAGLPIVGDPKYGVLARGVNRPLLHALRLEFTHPRSRAEVRLQAPIPWDQASMRRLAPAPRPSPTLRDRSARRRT
jgi:RluA family pseudouridine synthase